jgi:hypothetical protein
VEIRGAGDRRTVEITYVVISSVVYLGILAACYKLLVDHLGVEAQAVLNTTRIPAMVVAVALLLVRAVRLLRQFEVDVRAADDH